MFRYTVFIPAIVAALVLLNLGLVSAAEYRDIDQHANNAPASVGRDLRTLSDFLSKPARNEREKVRAIYIWITRNIGYDYDSASNFIRSKDESAKGVLASRKALCAGFSHLFLKLARLSGLEVAAIGGQAKGYGYKVGDRIKSSQSSARDAVRRYYEQGFHRRKRQGPTVLSLGGSNHAWNAVKLDGRWWLLDATWGAVDIATNRFSNGGKAYLEHYFLTPPEQFIYDHYPDKRNWQLLKRTISMKEFERMPLLKPAFFRYGMSIRAHIEVVAVSQAATVLSFTAPPDIDLVSTLVDLKTGGKIRIAPNPAPSAAQPISFTKSAGRTYELRLSMPKKRDYRLKVFAKKRGSDRGYRMVAEHRLIGLESE